MKCFALKSSKEVTDLIFKEKLKWKLYCLGYVPLGILLMEPEIVDIFLGFIIILCFWGSTLLIQFFIEHKLKEITKSSIVKFKLVNDVIIVCF